MNKAEVAREIERLRDALSKAIDNNTNLTDPCVIENSILLDHVLNLYSEIIKKE
ncbi:MAG: Spo0E like sporulation regulatory protein [Clostridia bacterium]|jgi:hypothetical protein|nr:Spo0E like sporulation regulatory protein [Clostridia bacterium]